MTAPTIEPPFTEKPQDLLSRSIHTSGAPLSHPTAIPGQDGYRTPTIEDYDQHGRQNQPYRRPGGHSTSSSFMRLPISTAFSGNAQNLSNTSINNDFWQKLEWRERIRHYTWTFFTMTMATGGIANVLYSGND